jgi:hypothetical protein
LQNISTESIVFNISFEKRQETTAFQQIDKFFRKVSNFSSKVLVHFKQVKGKCITSNFKENGQNVQILNSVVDLDEHD